MTMFSYSYENCTDPRKVEKAWVETLAQVQVFA